MKQINKWKLLTEDITDIFIREYFEIPDDEDADFSWVNDEVGGIFEFADMFFSFGDVLNCYKHKVTKDQLFNWYDFCIDNQFVNISLAKFVLSSEERSKNEQESLKKSKESLNFAEAVFKQELENHKNEL